MWWASLKDPTGSGPGFRRPVLIISADNFNRSRIGTVVVAVVTSNLRLAAAPGNVRLAARTGGLPKPSVVNVSQVITLDKTFLTSRAGRLPASRMHDVDEGLRLALDL